jgi:hypothetical protein
MRWIDVLRDLIWTQEDQRRKSNRKFAELWEYVTAQTEANTAAFERLESRMTSVEQQTWDELGRLVGVIVAEVTSLRDGIAQKDAALQAALAALEDAESAAATQVQEALDADSAADAERSLSLIDQIKAALPAEVEVPDVPVPPVGEPAEEPTPAEPTEPEAPVDETPVDEAPVENTNPDGSTDTVNPTPVDENGNPV